MTRRLSLLVVFVGVLGLLGLAPASQASHDLVKKGGDPSEGTHEAMPGPPNIGTPVGTCLVAGEVNIGNQSGTGGIGVLLAGSNKSHNHYRFLDTEITCVSPDPNFSGRLLVDAAGGTDGPADASGNHGEDVEVGWSHSSCYDDDNAVKAPGAPASCDPPATSLKGADLDDLYDGTNTMGGGTNACNNCGEIEVANATNGTTASCTPGSRFAATHQCQASAANNVVMFCRGAHQAGLSTCPGAGGANVIAWGALHLTNTAKKGVVLCFFAEPLWFTATNGDGGVTKKFDQATLQGSADLWLAADNDKADCFGLLKGKKQG